MSTREGCVGEWDELDALFAAGLEPLRGTVAPPRVWKRLLHRLVWGQKPWQWLHLWAKGWGVPQLVSPYAPQPLSGGRAGWLMPPVVGAMATRLQVQRLTC